MKNKKIVLFMAVFLIMSQIVSLTSMAVGKTTEYNTLAPLANSDNKSQHNNEEVKLALSRISKLDATNKMPTLGKYTLESDYVVLELESINLSKNKGTVMGFVYTIEGVTHIAVASIDPIDTLVINTDTILLPNSKVDLLPPKAPLVIESSDKMVKEYKPQDYVKSKLNDPHWTVFKFNSDDTLEKALESLNFTVKSEVDKGDWIQGESYRFKIPTYPKIEANKVFAQEPRQWPSDDSLDVLRRPDKVILQLIGHVTSQNKSYVVREAEIAVGTADLEFTQTWLKVPKYNLFGKKYDYFTVDEKTVPEGYTKVVTGNLAEPDSEDSTSLMVTNTYNKIHIKVTKTWNGTPAASVTFKLLANNVDTGETLTLTQANWTGYFINLDKYDGQELIEYTIEESELVGYESVITGSQEEGFTITNTQEIAQPEKIDVAVEKFWQGKVLENVTINLLAEDKLAGTIELSESNNWKHVFTDLDKVNASGDEIQYTVEEIKVEGYKTEITGTQGDGFMVTNTQEIPLISVAVEKVWLGKVGDKVTVNLLADGKQVDTVDLSKDNSWKHSFSKLPAVNKISDEKQIEYTVEEIKVEGYKTEITGSQEEGFTITNTQEIAQPEKIDVAVEKFWQGKVLENVTINLLAEDKLAGTIELSESNNWKHVFTDLDKVNASGDEIQYTVEEIKVEGYKTEITGTQEDGFMVTNTQEIPLITVAVEKVWVGKVGDKVTVNLLADGKQVDTVDLSKDNSWKHSFSKLPAVNKISDEKQIEYKVEELKAEGYKTEITGSQEDGFIVTNTQEIPLISVAVEKVWLGKVGDKVTVNLLADGKQVDTVDLSKDNSWKHSFSKLPAVNKISDEKKIEYKVEELKVEGYKTEITGSQEEGFIVTNTEEEAEPVKTEVRVAVVWVGKVGDKVTINLLADGKKVDTVDLSKDNSWKHSFSKLPAVNKISDEKKIQYTVEEIKVEGYKTEITGNQEDGFIVTNTQEIPLASVAVEKVWVGKVGDKVTINLLADGKKVDTVDLSKDNSWKHSFSKLPAVNNITDKKKIEYTVEELKVEGYKTEITGNQEDGFIVTNAQEIPLASVAVEKVWVGKVGEKVTIDLLADGKKVDTIDLSKDNSWKHSFSKLPAVNKITDKKKIEYTVEELKVDGYKAKITGNQEEGFTITNTEDVPVTPNTPIKGKLNVKKVWIGKVGDKATINLLADGVKVDTVVLSKSNNWKHTFMGLPNVNKITDKKPIVYTLEEVKQEGYKTNITLSQEEGFTVTNTEKIPLIPIDVEKVWIGKVGDKATINLLADGKKIDTIVLSKTNDWKHTFANLPTVNKISDEKKIEYTVEEVKLEGYKAKITRTQKYGFKITNTEESKPSKPILPSTGSKSADFLIVLALVFLVVGVLLMKKRGSKKDL